MTGRASDKKRIVKDAKKAGKGAAKPAARQRARLNKQAGRMKREGKV